MSTERELILAQRRRGIILKFVRDGHENQMPPMDDFEAFAVMQQIGLLVGRDQVLTMLQDLQVLGYIDFKQTINEETGRTELSQIVLTAVGLRFMDRGKSNDDVLLG